MRFIDDIINSFRSSLTNLNSPLAEFSDYSNLYMIFRSIASIISEQEFKLSNVNNNLYLSSAVGEYLDRIGADYGVYRNPGLRGVGFVIGITNVPRTIEKGTILTVRDTLLTQLEVVADTSIFNESLIEVRAVQPGFTSLLAGTVVDSELDDIIFYVGTNRNASTNTFTGSFISGGDRETDEDYRNRILNSLKNPLYGTYSHIISSIEALGGISFVEIQNNTPVAGYITVLTDNKDPLIIQGIRRIIEEETIGIGYFIKTVDNYTVNLSLEVTLSQSEVDLNIFQSQIEAVVVDLFNNLSAGEVVTRQRLLGRVGRLIGVQDVEVTSSNLPTAVNSEQILKLSNLSVSYIVGT